MNFDLSEEQQMIVDTVAKWVEVQSPVERFRKCREDDRTWDRETWAAMGEYGWLGVEVNIQEVRQLGERHTSGSGDPKGRGIDLSGVDSVGPTTGGSIRNVGGPNGLPAKRRNPQY